MTEKGKWALSQLLRKMGTFVCIDCPDCRYVGMLVSVTPKKATLRYVSVILCRGDSVKRKEQEVEFEQVSAVC